MPEQAVGSSEPPSLLLTELRASSDVIPSPGLVLVMRTQILRNHAEEIGLLPSSSDFQVPCSLRMSDVFMAPMRKMKDESLPNILNFPY